MSTSYQRCAKRRICWRIGWKSLQLLQGYAIVAVRSGALFARPPPLNLLRHPTHQVDKHLNPQVRKVLYWIRTTLITKLEA